MCVGDCIKKHIWKGIAIILLISTITFAVLYATKVYNVNIFVANFREWIIGGSFLSYKITISLKNSRKIAFYRVATFLLQPVADVRVKIKNSKTISK